MILRVTVQPSHLALRPTVSAAILPGPFGEVGVQGPGSMRTRARRISVALRRAGACRWASFNKRVAAELRTTFGERDDYLCVRWQETQCLQGTNSTWGLARMLVPRAASESDLGEC